MRTYSPITRQPEQRETNAYLVGVTLVTTKAERTILGQILKVKGETYLKEMTELKKKGCGFIKVT